MQELNFLVHFENLGCRLNQTETEALADDFQKAGFSVFLKKDNPRNVAIVFVNTCTVTSKAEQKCRRVIRYCVRKFPNALIIVSGCYAQMEKSKIEKIAPAVKTFPGMQKGFLSRFPKYYSMKLSEFSKNDFSNILELSKDIFTQFKKTLPDTEKSAKKLSGSKTKVSIKSFNLKPRFAFDLTTKNFTFHSRASLKVQDGCNGNCSFCRIKLARGKSISLNSKTVVERAKKIEDAGKNEIVLTGVNLAQYNFDGVNFPKLLNLLLAGTSQVKFRISSFYPEAITDEFLQAITDKRICPYFHLSVQSGSERILRLMNRPSDVQNIYMVCEKLKLAKPNVFLGADIITGFPTETDEDFELTYKLCEDLGFAHIHCFPFSPRPNTEAYYLKPKIPEKIVEQRAKSINELSSKNYKVYLKSVNGKIFTGIVQNFKDGKKILTENYLVLPLKESKLAKNFKSGDRVTIKIDNNFCKIC